MALSVAHVHLILPSSKKCVVTHNFSAGCNRATMTPITGVTSTGTGWVERGSGALSLTCDAPNYQPGSVTATCDSNGQWQTTGTCTPIGR